MTLTTCRDCGHAVSTTAQQCPSCGAVEPWRRPVRLPPVGALVGWAVAAAGVVLFFAMCFR